MPPLHHFIRNFHCGKGALCFCFDLANVFLQGANIPPLHPKPFFGIVIIVRRGITLLLRLSRGISSGFRHATPTPKNIFSELSLWEGALCFRFDLAKVFLQGATMPPHIPNFFVVIFIIVGRGNYASAST